MNQNQNLAAVTYPPPQPSTAPGPYAALPPPAGYPTKERQAAYPQNPVPVTNKSRGDGFWKGCCAALCCCCLLDACF